ncbi:vesicular integral-membrane protein VIP36-like [Haliotis asinina]|uniref:vesicular integral-membrane protein VIP36-like n=1 Tax=Haliotis asinina TaxID=109174 RepID=UPI003531EADE
MEAHMKSCRLLVVFGLILSVFGQWESQEYLRREHTLTKPYQGSGMSVPLWDFQGSTLVTNQYIRLTSDHQSLQGAIWNTAPCFVRNWELHIQFKIHGSGKNLFGDGLAIWYTRERMQMGSIFGSKDNFIGLAIFLDTYSNHNGPHNHQHPYISAMVNNGSLSYDHDTDGTHTQISGCEAQFRNKDYDTFLAIRYENNELKVSTDIANKNSWAECFLVKGIRLPVGYYFGVTAATGDLADNHDIISMKLYDLDKETDSEKKTEPPYTGLPVADHMEAPRDRVDDNKGSYILGSLTGWKLFVVIFLILIGISVCGIVGFVVFQRNQDYSRKRFY